MNAETSRIYADIASGRLPRTTFIDAAIKESNLSLSHSQILVHCGIAVSV